ncbi:uncharacterized protein ZBAI_01170 [Zygosaccharomyces bailii ISA1307]|nr:uncharacterized protein ZBAI_01170 [Zygosaccharomyces bailii ISA1307]
MSDQVGRKKSYRWVSASQASYDGSEWDSDDDGGYGGGYGSYGQEKDAKGSLERANTISKLPALPKLDYDGQREKVVEKANEEEEEIEPEIIGELPDLPGDIRVESFGGSDKPANYVNDTAESSSQEQQNLTGVKPSPLGLEVQEEPVIPNLEEKISGNSSKDSLSRRTPVNEDLDNLMAEISREMEQNAQEQSQEDELDWDDDLSASGEEGYGVSKSGYFTKLVESDDDDVQARDEEAVSIKTDDHALELEVYSPKTPLERNVLSTSLSYSQSSKETGLDSPKEEVQKRGSSPSSPEIIGSHAQLKSPVSKGSSLEESEDDALSYTESLDYHTSRNDAHEYSEKFQEVGGSESDSDESAMRIHKSGYFGKMVHDEGNDVETIHKEKAEDVGQTEDAPGNKNEGIEQGSQNAEEALQEDELDPHNKSIESKINAESEECGSDRNINKSISGKKSVNLGGWRPDTSAARSGFLEETARKAPPGYVYDEDGKLVDLTPSSMKPRVVSAYSEAESAWNPFPSNHNDELETIKDTKTLYDNQTIYNVPGLMTNNQNMPPLPNIDSQQHLANQPTGSNSSDPKSLTVGSSIATLSEIDSDKGPLQSHFKEILGGNDMHEESQTSKGTKESAPVKKSEIPKAYNVNGASAVPQLDLNKVISSKNSHASKIHELQRYYNQMLEHETGIEAWIEASLKTSAKPERGFLFEEYKVNKHVKDAYANADELSKKHTVSNTVASVNQNVSQLTKKVFSHPMKSRGLFASIGKKRI